MTRATLTMNRLTENDQATMREVISDRLVWAAEAPTDTEIVTDALRALGCSRVDMRDTELDWLDAAIAERREAGPYVAPSSMHDMCGPTFRWLAVWHGRYAFGPTADAARAAVLEYIAEQEGAER